MIFDTLVMDNFGPYRGRHQITLTPRSRHRPIVLFGGLNGRGKTTILEAIQLALYGKLARSSSRGNLGFPEYLRRCIHHGETSAAVEVHFRSQHRGEEESLSVRRSWSSTPTGGDHVRIDRNGRRTPLLEDTWDTYVEQFLPVGIAPLFFFDGEKIEGLAEPTTSREVLSTAVSGLLGLNLIQQLSVDLSKIELTKLKSRNAPSDQTKVSAIEETLQQLALEKDTTHQDLHAAESALQKRTEDFRRADELFKREGGELYEKRLEVETLARTKQSELDNTANALIDVAGGSAPLLLVSDLLGSVREQDRTESAETLDRETQSLLEQRDLTILEFLTSKTTTDEETLSRLAGFLEEDRDKRHQPAATESFLFLSEAARIILSSLQSTGAKKLRTEIKHLLGSEEKLRDELILLEQRADAVPRHEAIAELTRNRDKAREDFVNAEAGLRGLKDKFSQLDRRLEASRLERTKILERDVAQQFSHEESGRIAEYSKRTRAILEEFNAALLKQHSRNISAIVLESFQKLLGKSNLVNALEVDPESFSVRLSGSQGKELTPDRLSAGERQLLAIAMLWGLARLSGRALPTVIDTPLGRLDSSHRSNIVDRYFPNASHQVILLSTDEEINESYYSELKSSVGRSYLLEYDDAEGCTTIRDGYFW